jgi:hypothetical protein
MVYVYVCRYIFCGGGGEKGGRYYIHGYEEQSMCVDMVVLG